MKIEHLKIQVLKLNKTQSSRIEIVNFKKYQIGQ